METWEQRAQQPLKRVEEFVKKTAFGNAQEIAPPYLQKATPQVQQFQPIQPYGGHAILPEQIAQVKEQNVFAIPTIGTVALIWRDDAADQAQIPKEDGYPTFSDTYMCDYRDYATEEEKIAAVEFYLDLIAKYNAKTPKRGSYVIFTGAVVDKIVTKKIITY